MKKQTEATLNPTKSREKLPLLLCPLRSPLDEEAGWQARHRSAVACPRDGFECAYGEMLRGWLRYADAHQERYASPIGQDGVLGPCWAQIGAGLRGLLNGEHGRLDAGTLDSILVRALQEEEFDPDRL